MSSFPCQDRLIELTEEIGSRLEYFQELEHATRLLNHPGESLVLQSDFLYMVERVDICIEYLKSHVSNNAVRRRWCQWTKEWFSLQRHYKEADIYLLRFQQCMTRAMTLIKMYFVGSLRALSADVSRRLSEKVRMCTSHRRGIGFIRLNHHRKFHKQHNTTFFIPGSTPLHPKSNLYSMSLNVGREHTLKNFPPY